MNWGSIEIGWKDYKATAKRQWTKLSDKQLERGNGKRVQLSLHVQEAYGISKEEAERQVAAWQARQKEQPPETLET